LVWGRLAGFPRSKTLLQDAWPGMTAPRERGVSHETVN
jgi:hypothetical protein